MTKQRFLIGLALLATAISQSVMVQSSDEGSPRLVQLTESVFRVVHRPMAANTSVVVTDEGLIVIDATCRGEGNTQWLKNKREIIADPIIS